MWGVFTLSGLDQCRPHGDEGKIVRVRETLVSGEVEGLPCEWTQPPLHGGAIYSLRSQLESHLVVRHLQRDAEIQRRCKKKCFFFSFQPGRLSLNTANTL